MYQLTFLLYLLGPLLFFIYIHDFQNCSTFDTLFADDTSGLKSSNNLPELFALVNSQLTKMADV
jgi:hypothetical protein